MNWIKKILSKLQKKEEQSFDEYIEPNIEREVVSKDDIETRVIYQYPQGVFRFPLIPDEEVETRKREPRRTRRVKIDTEASVPKENKVVPLEKQAANLSEQRENKKMNRSKRPFRPSETPSPIYGYKRNNDQPIVFELDDFSSDEREEQNKKDSQSYITLLHEDKIVVNDEKALMIEEVQEENKTAYFASQAEEEEAAANKVETEQVELTVEGEATDVIEEAGMIVEEKVPEELIIEAEGANVTEEIEIGNEVTFQEPSVIDVETADVTEETEMGNEVTFQEQPVVDVETADVTSETEIENGVTFQEQSIVDAEIPNLTEETEMGNEVTLQESSVADVETADVTSEIEMGKGETFQEELAVEPEPSNFKEDANSQEDGLFQADSEHFVHEINEVKTTEEETGILEEFQVLEAYEKHTDFTVENDVIDDDINMSHDIAAEENSGENTAINTQETSSAKRRHIPFNVVMLQSDKRKLQTKEQEKVKETNKSQEISLNSQAYSLPTMNFLNPPIHMNIDKEWTEKQQELLNETLFHFNVRATVKNVTQGPSVTRFEVHPEPGVKVNKITNLADDIKLSLAARDIRIEAPIPGTHLIGIEVPNVKSRPVFISEVLNHEVFQSHPSPLAVALGLDISGKAIVTDIRKMPHGLIAGSTGSGKSVCINSILISILYKARPDEVKLMLIDPKVVELQPYNDIPHLVSPVITDVKAATAALKWAVDEMERRYEAFAAAGVRDIGKFNEKALEENQPEAKLPYLVIIIDELADLMMMSPADVEEAICRIAQKARACGIHLIIATQRPSVDVITGLIKANIPTRVAFSVSSQVDSRTIIDHSGAERLLGKGDMLFLGNGTFKPVRLQGTFVSDEEIAQVVEHVKGEQAPQYLFEQEELIKKTHMQDEEDELFFEACEFILEQGHASASSLQRRFKIGYNRAARLIESMEANGFISESKGSKPRDVLFTEEDLHSLQ